MAAILARKSLQALRARQLQLVSFFSPRFSFSPSILNFISYPCQSWTFTLTKFLGSSIWRNWFLFVAYIVSSYFMLIKKKRAAILCDYCFRCKCNSVDFVFSYNVIKLPVLYFIQIIYKICRKKIPINCRKGWKLKCLAFLVGIDVVVDEFMELWSGLPWMEVPGSFICEWWSMNKACYALRTNCLMIYDRI